MEKGEKGEVVKLEVKRCRAVMRGRCRGDFASQPAKLTISQSNQPQPCISHWHCYISDCIFMTIRSLLLLVIDDYWIHIEAQTQTQTSHDQSFTCERRSRGGSRYLSCRICGILKLELRRSKRFGPVSPPFPSPHPATPCPRAFASGT